MTSVIRTGVIGGRLGYQLLRVLDGHVARQDYCSGKAYEGRSKLESLFGQTIWGKLRCKSVIDFGCGTGVEAIEVARHGARRVIGIDLRRDLLDQAEREAARGGVLDRCLFTTHTDERADVILSIDSFEHYDDPRGVLRMMRGLIQPDGRLMISFGPPWFHPLGGHLFSVFPWAHLIFSEQALIRWRADFKSDGATRFCEVTGGLNQMTVRRFERLLEESDFEVVEFAAVPIRRLRRFANRLTREFLTSTVRCTLVPRGAASTAS